MKKVNLTNQEKEAIKEVQEASRKAKLAEVEYAKAITDFWHLLYQRLTGEFSINPIKGEVTEMPVEEKK